MTMNGERLHTIEQVNHFLKRSKALDSRALSTENKYRWTESTLMNFDDNGLKKAGQRLIRQYLHKDTGYSRAKVSRLVNKRVRMDRANEKNRIRKAPSYGRYHTGGCRKFERLKIISTTTIKSNYDIDSEFLNNANTVF